MDDQEKKQETTITPQPDAENSGMNTKTITIDNQIWEVIEVGGCAPPVLATVEKGRRWMESGGPITNNPREKRPDAPGVAVTMTSTPSGRVPLSRSAMAVSARDDTSRRNQ